LAALTGLPKASSTPHALRGLNDERQFSDLVLWRDIVADDGGSKAALGTDANSFERNILAGFSDTSPQ
jgi:hypothetical protein